MMVKKIKILKNEYHSNDVETVLVSTDLIESKGRKRVNRLNVKNVLN